VYLDINTLLYQDKILKYKFNYLKMNTIINKTKIYNICKGYKLSIKNI